MGEFKKLVIDIEGRVYIKKNSRRIFKTRTGRTMNLPSKNFEVFKESALWQLKKYKEKLKPPYEVAYIFYIKGKQDADLDNLIASVNDVLEDAGIIENDKLIMKFLDPEKILHQDDFKTRIIIYEKS